MPLEVKLWKIDANRPVPVPQEQLDLEGRLEDWLCEDISLLNDELMVIGRQIRQYGVPLDLLAADREGNLVVIELKRDRTPRDVVAQALDYASWVQGFGLDDVERYTQQHRGTSFQQAFRSAFDQNPPDVINERQRMYIVASSLDAATQRIVEYLSATHGVDINAATFAYFKTSAGEFVGRSMLLAEEDVERRARDRHRPKRQPARTEEELRAIAEERGVADVWDIALDGFGRVSRKARSRTTLFFQSKLEGGYGAILSIFPELSAAEQGLAVTVVVDHMARAFGVEERQIREVCGSPAAKAFGGSYSREDNCFHLDRHRLESLVALIVKQSGE